MISKIKQVSIYLKLKKAFRKNGTILKSINISSNIKIGQNCLINKRVMLGDNVEIGDYTYLNSSKYWITLESNVKIGKFCSIAPGVHIGAGNHDYNLVTTHPILFDKYYEQKIFLKRNIQKKKGLKDLEKSTEIKNDVWIGLNSIIKRGITIGNGAVIAAGSVVVKDVPDYAIVGGNPAQVIKYRTTEENIKYLKENEKELWWNWNKEKFTENIDYLYDFEKYIEYLKKGENK